MATPVQEYPGGQASLFEAQSRRVGDAKGVKVLQNLMTKKELFIIGIICLIGAAVFRLQDAVFLHLTWTQRIDPFVYMNGEFPIIGEKLPQPVIGDFDGDGVTDMLMQTGERKLVMLTWPTSRSPVKPHSHSPIVKAEVELPLVANASSLYPPRIIAIGAGYLRLPPLGAKNTFGQGAIKFQNIVVLASDWTVFCMSSSLTMKWTKKIAATPGDELFIREPVVLLTHHTVHHDDSEGTVIVGGRPTLADYGSMAEKRTVRGKPIKPDQPQHDQGIVDHYNTYALSGKDGTLRWKHEHGDFEEEPAYTYESPFTHFKLKDHNVHKHTGEVYWRQYTQSLISVMPYSWTWDEDSHCHLAHFRRDKRPSGNLGDEIVDAGSRVQEHLKEVALGKKVDSVLKEHESPNVVVIHSNKGVEVLHFYQGRPLCTLPLSSHHASHADIDSDGRIEHVHAVMMSEEGQEEEGADQDREKEVDCYGQAVKGNGEVVFHHSICKPMHWLEAFVAIDEYAPQLSRLNRKPTNHHITEPLAPVLIPSALSTRFNLHIIKTTRVMDKLRGSMMDSVFALSNGRVTSIGPHGEFNWQVDTDVDWDKAAEILHGGGLRGENFDPFVLYSFTPSLKSYSYKVGGVPVSGCGQWEESHRVCVVVGSAL
jgi:hypothetical protein